GDHFRTEPANRRVPGRLGRVRRLARLLLAAVLTALFVGETVARQGHALGVHLAGETADVVARPRAERRELAGIDHQAALDVEVADQGVKHADGIRGVKAGAAHGAAVGVGHGLLAVAGEALGQG